MGAANGELVYSAEGSENRSGLSLSLRRSGPPGRGLPGERKIGKLQGRIRKPLGIGLLFAAVGAFGKRGARRTENW